MNGFQKESADELFNEEEIKLLLEYLERVHGCPLKIIELVLPMPGNLMSFDYFVESSMSEIMQTLNSIGLSRELL